MSDLYDLVIGLTGSDESEPREGLVREFSRATGWHPSYVRAPRDAYVNSHLLVEHGLEHAAVISFLKDDVPLSGLSFSDRASLLSLSYNNLVDWHIAVERDRVTYLYNLADEDPVIDSTRISRDNTEALRVEAFDKIIGRKPSKNVRALDDALINTISDWKRKISSELGQTHINSELSNLFNGLIFARAAEDHCRYINRSGREEFALRRLVAASDNTLQDMLTASLQGHIGDSFSQNQLIDLDSLQIFDKLDPASVRELVSDFYSNKYARRYQYDFSVISNHALSRIYERYVSILTVREEVQLSLWGAPVDESKAAQPGAVYTPEFIARFFARYIQDNFSPAQFRKLSVVDPACGSGIFLRTLLEAQYDPSTGQVDNQLIKQSIEDLTNGHDIDENAVSASRLSIALLSLVLTDSIPARLAIQVGDALESQTKWAPGPVDVVVMNPPYIRYEMQSDALRSEVHGALTGLAIKKPDTYTAFIRRAIDELSEGGLCCAVVPRSLLIGGTTKSLRDFIQRECMIRCIVDLSRINVFDADAYVVLLILEKRAPKRDRIPAQLVKCWDYPGTALQDLLEQKSGSFASHSIASVHQTWFERSTWAWSGTDRFTPSGREEGISLGELAEVRQGFITGLDRVFIVDSDQVPPDSRAIFVPYLPDRMMKRFAVPARTGRHVFLPELEGEQLTLEEIQNRFPGAYEFLLQHKAALEEPRAVQSGTRPWWRPMRMRNRAKMLVPKIVTPHLMFLPRFALDEEGKYAVSRSPYIAVAESGEEGTELLAYITAVLNSDRAANWLSANCHTYSRGYTMLEVQPLREIPIPDPRFVPRGLVSEVITRVLRDGKKMVDAGSKEATELNELVEECWRSYGG